MCLSILAAASLGAEVCRGEQGLYGPHPDTDEPGMEHACPICNLRDEGCGHCTTTASVQKRSRFDFFFAVWNHQQQFEIDPDLHTHFLRIHCRPYHLPAVLTQRGHKVMGSIDYAHNAPPLGPLVPTGWKKWGMVCAVEVDYVDISMYPGATRRRRRLRILTALCLASSFTQVRVLVSSSL